MRTTRSSPAVLLLAYLAFVSLGLPDAVLGVAWPSLREAFALPQALLGAPLTLGAAAWFASGMVAGRLIRALGIGRLLAASTALVAVGMLGFAAAPAWAAFLVVVPLVGFGSGAIDAALNTHAARAFGPKHMSWLHAAYAAGAALGPAVMALALATSGWRGGYALIAALLGAMALTFGATRGLWGRDAPAEVVLDAPGGVGPLPAEEHPIRALAVLHGRAAWLQIALFFVYTGLELTAGQWSYTILTEERGLSGAAAGAWVSAYWGGLLVGRLVLGWAAERVGPVRLLRLATIGALGSAAVFVIPAGAWTVAALPLLSFSLASIYPGLMAETPRRLGERAAAHAVGFQVSAATLGVAVLPALAGVASERFGLEAIGVGMVCGALGLVVLHELLVATTEA